MTSSARPIGSGPIAHSRAPCRAGKRAQAREVLYSERYRDQPPHQVYNDPLGRGEYIVSLSTFHRLLAADRATGECRDQRAAQHHAIPRLTATVANEV